MNVKSQIFLTKHHGLGNDFLVALDITGTGLGVSAELARSLCDRRTGVGADGLILGVPHPSADLAMILYNADGSRAEMSGNGIRCLAQAVADELGQASFAGIIATDGGPRRVAVQPTADRSDDVLVEVDMGEVRPGPAVAPWPRDLPDVRTCEERVATADVGNPHLVIEVDDPAGVDVARFGSALESGYVDGMNVHFIARGPGPNALDLVVWERGAGVTQACGTGATAAAAVAARWGLVDDGAVVTMPGGTVDVRLGETATLIGPAVRVASVQVSTALWVAAGGRVGDAVSGSAPSASARSGSEVITDE